MENNKSNIFFSFYCCLFVYRRQKENEKNTEKYSLTRERVYISLIVFKRVITTNIITYIIFDDVLFVRRLVFIKS